MSRVAICLFGMVGGRSLKAGDGQVEDILDPSIAYELMEKNIVQENDEVDYFIHSWSMECKQKLEELYRPKISIIEPQVDFSQTKLSVFRAISWRDKLKLLFSLVRNRKSFKSQIDYWEWYAFRTHSRWYSTKQVVELKKTYEEKHDFVYDVVLLTRLDVGFFTPIRFSEYDMNFFYASNRNQAPTKENGYKSDRGNHDEGNSFLDLWYFSSSSNIDRFAVLYDVMNRYALSPHKSSWQHVCKVIGKSKVRYTLYRWFDHEIIRRKLFKSEV